MEKPVSISVKHVLFCSSHIMETGYMILLIFCTFRWATF